VLTLLAYSWHGQSDKGIVYCWYCLYVGGQDLCVFSQVEHECVTGPSTFDLHHIEGEVLSVPHMF